MEQSADVSEGKSKLFAILNVLSFFRLCLIPLTIWLYCAEHNYLWAGNVYGARWHGKIATFLLDVTMVLHIFWNGITPAISMAFIISCTISIALSLVLYGKKDIKSLNRAKQFAARRKPKWKQKQSSI